MDPHRQCCHNPACPTRGQRGQGNIVVQSQQEHRSRCLTCGQTVAATTGTPFSRVQKGDDLVTRVLTSCVTAVPSRPLWRPSASMSGRWPGGRHGLAKHCQQVHVHLVHQGRVDVQHVQADELWVTLGGRRVWMAMALAVPSRLWLGGVMSPHRDRLLITTLVQMVRAGASSLAVLVCVDGLASDVTAFLRVCRHAVRTGRPGRPRRVVEPGLLLGQVVTQSAQRRVTGVVRRVVRGTAEAIAAGLAATGGGTVLKTASIERLTATVRSALATLVRRGRALAHTEGILTAGMSRVGCAYHCCWPHDSLRLPAPANAPRKWHERTPARAAA